MIIIEATGQVGEDLEEEIFEGVTPDVEKCTKQCATSAEMTAKFLLGQVEINLYIVVIVLKGKKVEVQGDQVEEVQEAQEGPVLKEETILVSSYWSKSAL